MEVTKEATYDTRITVFFFFTKKYIYLKKLHFEELKIIMEAFILNINGDVMHLKI